jgi:hypothetical protein
MLKISMLLNPGWLQQSAPPALVQFVCHLMEKPALQRICKFHSWPTHALDTYGVIVSFCVSFGRPTVAPLTCITKSVSGFLTSRFGTVSSVRPAETKK